MRTTRFLLVVGALPSVLHAQATKQAGAPADVPPATQQIAAAVSALPAEYRESGFVDFLSPGTNWVAARRSLLEDEFCLDPTRITLVCGTAG